MIALTCLAAIACSATPNPKLTNEPAAWTPPPKSAPNAAGAPNGASTGGTSTGGASTGSSTGASTPSTSAVAQGAQSKPVPASTAPGAAAVATTAAATATQDAGAQLAGDPPKAPMPVHDPGGDAVVAMIGDKPVTVSEFLAQLVHQNAIEALDQLDHLVLTHLVQEEARRLGVKLDPDLVEHKYSDAVVQIEQKIGEKRPNVTLDQWVDQVLGLDPLVYRTQLREDSLNQLLAERVTRAFMLQSEHADLRVIVVKSEEKLKEAQAALAGGEAFEEVAKRLSADPSAKEGGRVPPVIRSETVMGKLAFQTKVGEIGGPQYSQGAWLLVKVQAMPAPLAGTWPEIAPSVEKSLAERHIEELEFTQWKGAMLRRYRVDLSPFLRLAGQPVK